MLFTDGAFPDIRTWLPLDETVPRIGWESFHTDSHQQEEVLYSAMDVDEDVIEKWLPRLTQIGMIELLASVVAVEHMAKAMAGKTAILFVDSEAVEGCLVKGSSSREDQEDLVSIFWDLILEAVIGMYISRVPTDITSQTDPAEGIVLNFRGGYSRRSLSTSQESQVVVCRWVSASPQTCSTSSLSARLDAHVP